MGISQKIALEISKATVEAEARTRNIEERVHQALNLLGKVIQVPFIRTKTLKKKIYFEIKL